MSAKNEEGKMAKMNAKQEAMMAADPRARYKRHSRSQSEKVERKEVKLPHPNEQNDKRTSRQRKDEGPTNNGDKFPNTYREDKRKIRGPPHIAKKEFKKGDEVLLLSSNKGPHCVGRYIGPYVISRRIDKRTYRIDIHEGKKQTQVCHANQLKRYVRQEGTPRKIKNSEMLNKFEEKLSQLSVPERERGLREINKKIPRFISLTPYENVVAEYSFIVGERKKWGREKLRERDSSTSDEEREERKEKEILSPKLIIKIIKSSKVTKKERKKKEFTSLRLKGETAKNRERKEGKEDKIKEKEKEREREKEREEKLSSSMVKLKKDKKKKKKENERIRQSVKKKGDKRKSKVKKKEKEKEREQWNE